MSSKRAQVLYLFLARLFRTSTGIPGGSFSFVTDFTSDNFLPQTLDVILALSRDANVPIKVIERDVIGR